MDSVLVLIAAPGSGAIGPDVVARLRDLGAGELTWLAEGEAMETAGFDRVEDLAVGLAGLPIDINTVPAANRRKRILIADMDSTMIEQECIDELGVVAGVGDHIKDITIRAMRGELDFEGALRERVALLKDLDEAIIIQIIRERITFASGGRTLVATMAANGAHTALVSGGFTQFTAEVAKVLGFAENQANDLIVIGGRLNGEVREPILGQQAKVGALRRIAATLGLTSDDAIAVGDGANDLGMLGEAGMGVALHAKPNVQEKARIRINHGDLTALLYLQGYRRSEFSGV
jgi:phosphoserine phosphatase